MNAWLGKTAVITGAGSGIGAAIAKDLVKSGMTVLGIDHKSAQIKEMSEKAEQYKEYPGKLVPIKCDVSRQDEIKDVFATIHHTHGGVDVLVNNAAIAIDGFFSDGCLDSFKKVMDTNIFGMVCCTRHAVQSVQHRGGRGHIININSICGHYMPAFSAPRFNMYVLSKQAMTAFTEVLRREFRELQLNIKVTSISPGVVATDIFESSGTNVIDQSFLRRHPHLQPADVSAAVLHALSTPPHLQYHEIMMHALHEVY